MGIEIPGIGNPRVSPDYNVSKKPKFPNSESRLGHAGKPKPVVKERDIEKNVEILQETFRLFNRRLKFNVNREIDRVVVKVVDGTTDKVIKEIPPEEIQKLIARIKETIGILFDEEI
jgi:flagellar protein FlaG